MKRESDRLEGKQFDIRSRPFEHLPSALLHSSMMESRLRGERTISEQQYDRE